MALSDDIYNLLDEFGTNLKDDLQQSLRDKGVTFGGQDSKLSKSISFEIAQVGKAVTFKLKMPEYGEAVDKGRKAAGVSIEGQESISNWAKRKGIVGKFATSSLNARIKLQSEAKANNRNRKEWKTLKKPSFEKQLKAVTYWVSRKLQAKGYEGNHFYSEVIEDGRVEKLKQDLALVLKSNIEVEIIDLTKI